MNTTTTNTTTTVNGQGWWALAACRRVDPETFYPLDLDPTGPAVRAARRVCTGCPVLAECLADTLALEDPARRWGVIGGTTPNERAALYARQQADVAQTGAVAA